MKAIVYNCLIKVAVGLAGAAVGYALGYMFYQHAIGGSLFAVLGVALVPWFGKMMKERRNREFLGQFRQLLYALSSSLAAGRSVENALVAAEQDMRSLYVNAVYGVVPELSAINRKIASGWTMERAFAEFSVKTDLPDVQQFCEVFLLSKRSGGDMIELVRKTANLIAEKIEVEQDIQVMMAQKKFEAKAMAVVPFAMIGLMTISSPDYMAPLYEGIGRLIMTIVLLLLLGCYGWIRSITKLKV